MFAYTLLSYQSICEALNRLEPDAKAMTQELSAHWEILSEVIQTVLRTENVSDAYDKAKQFFRGTARTQEEVVSFIQSLPISSDKKTLLLQLDPVHYSGLASTLVNTYV